MAYAIDWSALSRSPDMGQAVESGFQRGRAMAQQQQRDAALRAYSTAPSMDALGPLAAVDPQAYGALYKVEESRAAAARSAQARAMVPDVLAGLGVGGSPTRNALSGGAPMPTAGEAPGGDVVVTAPVKHKTVADLYALDEELASSLIPRIGDLQEQQRKQLAFEADTLAAAAFAARQVKYEKRRDVIDRFRTQLTSAGFSQAEIDDFDPSDDALALAITHSLGIKNAMSQQLDEQKFAWQRQDDLIDNVRDDRRVAIQDRGQRDASARGWSADRRAERRYRRGDGLGGDLTNVGSDELINMLEQR